MIAHGALRLKLKKKKKEIILNQLINREKKLQKKTEKNRWKLKGRGGTSERRCEKKRRGKSIEMKNREKRRMVMQTAHAKLM